MVAAPQSFDLQTRGDLLPGPFSDWADQSATSRDKDSPPVVCIVTKTTFLSCAPCHSVLYTTYKVAFPTPSGSSHNAAQYISARRFDVLEHGKNVTSIATKLPFLSSAFDSIILCPSLE